MRNGISLTKKKAYTNQLRKHLLSQWNLSPNLMLSMFIQMKMVIYGLIFK